MGTKRPHSIAIVGGGVGGLAAALSLLRAGLDVHVYEQARTLNEVGAGVQISPNAARILHGLGLAGELDRVGVRPLALHQRRWSDGRTLLRTPLAGRVERAFGFPYYHVHRVELVSALAAAVPSKRLHLGHRLTDLGHHGDRVEARFANGLRAEADVLVGADGIHSQVRRAVVGPERPRFTGCVAYRALVPAARLRGLDLELAGEAWMGPGAHFVHYFVSGGRQVNVVAVIERDAWMRESWTTRGDVKDALAAFDGWHPQVRAILESVDETYVWALFDHAPPARWSTERVTLLGDAAHAMLPFMAQGAAQAIEDGATLAACLDAEGDVTAALRRYEALRIPRTARIQALSATNKTRFHLPDGPQQRQRDARMAAGATDFSYEAIAWIYGHDAAARL